MGKPLPPRASSTRLENPPTIQERDRLDRNLAVMMLSLASALNTRVSLLEADDEGRDWSRPTNQLLLDLTNLIATRWPAPADGQVARGGNKEGKR